MPVKVASPSVSMAERLSVKAPRVPPIPPSSAGGGPERSPLWVRVRFEGRAHRVGPMGKVLQRVSDAFVANTEEELEELLRELSEDEAAGSALAGIVRELSEDEAAGPALAEIILQLRRAIGQRRNRRAAFEPVVTATRNGSIEFEIAGTAVVAVWFLEKTLGASLSEAWKKSEAGKRFTAALERLFNKEFFLTRRDRLKAKLGGILRSGSLDIRLLSDRERKEALELVVTDRDPPEGPG
jgi:hypothetical protein